MPGNDDEGCGLADEQSCNAVGFLTAVIAVFCLSSAWFLWDGVLI